MSSENLNKAKTLFFEGMEYLQKNKYLNAEEKFLSALNLLPERLSIVGNLFTIYFNTNNKEKLKNLLIKYKNNSNEKEILYGKAINFYFENKFTESIQICEQLIKFNEIKEFILDLIALNYQRKNLFLNSLKILKKRLNIKKDSNIYYNIGNFFYEMGKPYQAYYYFNKSKDLDNSNESNLWNLSLCALTLGKLELGFSLYENRWLKKTQTIEKKFTEIKIPKSLNEVKNKNLLISDEQGLGDTIQFSRFVIDMLKYTKNITFVVNPKLVELLSNLNANINVVGYQNLKLQNFDYHISLWSLPNLLKIKNKSDINFYQLPIKENDKIKLRNKNMNVGISWSGSPKYPRDQYRSINFKEVESFLLKNKNINFYKLSRDEKNDHLINYNLLPNLTDLSKKSLYEISQILNQLDLIISVDTSIIHLAGILNVKSVLLLSYSSDWRWFSDRKNSIWYPSITILKQEKLNLWGGVFDKLTDILDEKKNAR